MKHVVKNQQKVSLIFPFESRVQTIKEIKKIHQAFSKTNRLLEIICVLDSNLKKTAAKIFPKDPAPVKLLFYPLKRFGKGFALCYGFKHSSGDFIFFWEGNFSISARELFLYLDLMNLVKADIVVGSKRHQLSSVFYSRRRRFYSTVYQLLVKFLFGFNLSDTQVGLKLYRRFVLEEVIPRIVIKNWAFDLELLVVAYYLGFNRIIEAPIEINKTFTSGKPSLENTGNLLRDTLAIFYRQKILRYYDQKFT